MLVRPVHASEHSALSALLLQDPLPNLFLLSLLEREGVVGERSRGVFYGLWEPDSLRAGQHRRELAATVYVSPTGLLVPWTPWSEHAAVLGRHVDRLQSLQLLIGPRADSDVLWAAMVAQGQVRVRYDQRLYVATEASRGPAAKGLRLARDGDLFEVARFSSRMMLEDLGFDPAARNAKAHLLSVRNRIREGRTWVVEREGQLVFKIDLGSSCSQGALVGGTYVVPELRGQGLCSSAMRGVIRHLLLEHPCVTLHLNEANAPAVGCYEAAGFRKDAALRLMVVEPPSRA